MWQVSPQSPVFAECKLGFTQYAKLPRELCDSFHYSAMNSNEEGIYFFLHIHRYLQILTNNCYMLNWISAYMEIQNMLSPVCHILFLTSLHGIDIGDINSYHTVRPLLIVPVESDLMNHLHGLSTFLTLNISMAWRGVCVDGCLSWQMLRTAKQRATKYKLMVRSVKAACSGHGLLELWQSKHRISANNLTRVQNLVVSLRMYFSLRFISRPSSSFTQPTLADLVGM
jgi:hypothetical protein